jgi:YidC/Oxa1 family membrane protein insertase
MLMDKRMLLFVVALSLALFAIRFGFDAYYAQDRQKWLQEQQARKKLSEEKTEEETAPLFEHVLQEKPQEKPQEVTYYLLENRYQQLVFSNCGGSLVEINLPFTSKADPFSNVLPIEVDREIERQSPINAHFPLFTAFDEKGQKHLPQPGGYYPLVRRDLLANADTAIKRVPPAFYSLNIVSEYPEIAQLFYKLKSFTANEIVFEAVQPQRRITKRFYFPENPDEAPYCLFLDIKVEGDNRGLWITSGVPEVEWQSGSIASNIKYSIGQGQKPVVEKVDLPKDSFTLSSVAPNWVCNSNGFFGIILDPLKGHEMGFRVERVPGNLDLSRLTLIDAAYDRFSAQELPGFNLLIPLKHSSLTCKFRIFAGPFAENVLKKVDDFYAKEEGGVSSDYLACQTFHGWFAFISEPFAKFIYFLMKIFYSIFGSWALSIVLVTVVLRLLLYPLNSWSLRSMKGMQQIAPHIKAIQERHKKDPQKAQLEMMALYRERKVNPFSGCLPLLLQMPFLIGMFDLLKSAYALRGASFIPGWIDDLSSPDVLFSWSYPLPLLGNEFHLLPILLGGIMYLQQTSMAQLPKDKSLWTDQQKQSHNMGLVMTIVMAVMFYQFPSGLNLYWISSMLLGMLQQWRTTKLPSEPIEAQLEVPFAKKQKLILKKP